MAQDHLAVSKTVLEKIEQIRQAAEEREAERLAFKYNLPYLNLSKSPINIEALSLLMEGEAKKAQAAIIEEKRKDILLLAHNPDRPEFKKLVQDLEVKGYKIKINIGSLSSLKHIWAFYQFVVPPGKGITGQVQIESGRLDELTKKLITLSLVKAELVNFKSPYISQILEVVLAGAMANRASDIHLESIKDGGRLRFRVDGELHDVVENLTATTYHSLISRLKLLSQLKLNVHNQAQDGRFTIIAGQKDIEMRVSVIPAEFGETIVMRILDPAIIGLTLNELGLRPDDMAIIDTELTKPNGLILNTGPTGSGKTTTLYAFLRRLYAPETKVITIEDPIEYHLPGIEQTQVDPEAGYSFANGLKAILRQDPDVILVGEIRDLETAEIAMHSSLTGHLVLSTLHTNDSAGTIPRLIDLGAKPPIIAPALNLVIAQRLVRRLCEHCKRPVKITPDLEQKVKKFIEHLPARVDRAALKEIKLFEPAGCNQCGDIGFRGREGIFELFVVSPEVEALIGQQPTEIGLLEIARKQGMTMMQDDGIITALQGRTTLKEVEKITGLIKWPE